MRKVDKDDPDINRIRYKSSSYLIKDDSDNIIAKYIIRIIKPICVKLGLRLQSTLFESISMLDIYVGDNIIRFHWDGNIIMCIKYGNSPSLQVPQELDHYIIDLYEGFTKDDVISLLTTKT